MGQLTGDVRRHEDPVAVGVSQTGVVEAEEAGRRRLERDIHDGVQQEMSRSWHGSTWRPLSSGGITPGPRSHWRGYRPTAGVPRDPAEAGARDPRADPHRPGPPRAIEERIARRRIPVELHGNGLASEAVG
jgi:hypothetical protein